jgi:hypothetical protein
VRNHDVDRYIVGIQTRAVYIAHTTASGHQPWGMLWRWSQRLLDSIQGILIECGGS